MNATSIVEQLDARLRAAPRSSQAERRRAALASFTARGFPTRRDEQWRYTDLKPLQESGFDLSPAPPDAAARRRVDALLRQQGIRAEHRLVFVDGHWDADLSCVTGLTGVDVIALTDAAAAFEPHPGSAADEKAAVEHPLATLNAAFAEHGALVRVAPDARVTESLHVVFAGSGRDQAAPQPRIAIDLAAGATATVVVHFLDSPRAAPAWLNLVTDVTLAVASQLTLYRIQAHGAAQYHTSLLRARVARDARLTAGYVEHGGRLARNDIDVALTEPGAHADLFGIVLAGGEQHVDNHVRVDHRAAQTTSVETFRAIAGGSARAVFSGKVIVRPGAQRIDARQSSDNLLLSDTAEIDTKPELEIYADDVKCSHGATIGELDESHLFYLRSRGIPEEQARALLTFAFAQVILERIDDAELRERAGRAIAGQLPGAPDIEAMR